MRNVNMDATMDVPFRYQLQGDKNALYRLLENVSHLCRVPVSEIRGYRRLKNIVLARQLFCAAARHLFPQKSLAEIGTVILRDHATVVYHCQDFNDKKNLKDEHTRHLVERFRILITEGV